jgi:hypothetical protein
MPQRKQAVPIRLSAQGRPVSQPLAEPSKVG